MTTEEPVRDRKARASVAALLLGLASLGFPFVARTFCPELATSAAWEGRWREDHEARRFFDDGDSTAEFFPEREYRTTALPDADCSVDPWGHSWWTYAEARTNPRAPSHEATVFILVVSAGPDGVFDGGKGDDIHPRNRADQGLAVIGVREAPLLLWLGAGLTGWFALVPRGRSGRRRGAAVLLLGACAYGRVGVLVAGVVMAWLLALPRLVRAERSTRLEVEALRVLGVGLLPALVAGAIGSTLGVPVEGWPVVSGPLAVGVSVGSVVLLVAAAHRARAPLPSFADVGAPPQTAAAR